MNKSLLLIIIILLTACKSTTTKVDYDPSTNFTAYSSYQLANYDKAEMGENTIMFERVKSAIKISPSIQTLNYSDENADLILSFQLTFEERTSGSSFSFGIGGTNFGNSSATSVGVGGSVPMDDDVNIFTQITINIFHQEKPIWHGSDGFLTTTDMTPVDIDSTVQATVDKILSFYPPKNN